jgi:hypothetical protein
MNNINNNSNQKIQNERKIKRLDLQSISKLNKMDYNYIQSSSKKSEYTNKDISNDKNEIILTDQDVKIIIMKNSHT